MFVCKFYHLSNFWVFSDWLISIQVIGHIFLLHMSINMDWMLEQGEVYIAKYWNLLSCLIQCWIVLWLALNILLDQLDSFEACFRLCGMSLEWHLL